MGPSYKDAHPWTTKGIHFISEGYNSRASFLADAKKVIAALQEIEPFNLTRINKYWMSAFAHYVPVGAQGGADAGIHTGTSGPSPGSTALDFWFNISTSTLMLNQSKIDTVISTLEIREADGTALNLKDNFLGGTGSPNSLGVDWNSVFFILIPENTSLPSSQRNRIEAEVRPINREDPYIVASSMNGETAQVLARALCLTAGLVDEFEGPDVIPANPEIKYINDMVPNVLLTSTIPSGVPGPDFKWYNYMTPAEQASPLVVIPHPNPGNPNLVLESKPVNTLNFDLHMGAANSVNNALRVGADSLLRRRIGESSLPVKDHPIEVGPVSNIALRSQITGLFTAQDKVRKYHDQATKYDQSSWSQWEKTADKTQILNKASEDCDVTLSDLGPNSDPYWTYKATANGTDGFYLEDIIVKWTKFNNLYEQKVLKKLEFIDLSIHWDDLSVTTIDLGQDLNDIGNGMVYGKLDSGETDSNWGFQRGIKLVIVRTITSNGTTSGDPLWKYTLEISVCFRDVFNDFEPGGALNAMKLFPEISFAWEPIQNWPHKVTHFYGDVKLTANPSSPHHNPNHSYFSFFTDSDNPFPKNASAPQRPDIVPVEPGASLLIVANNIVKLYYPTWSYLFDYVDTNIDTATEQLMVYGSGSAFPPPNRIRYMDYPGGYPNSGDVWTISKSPRQGAYDNIHTHGDMGMHQPPNASVPRIMAPFCLQYCVHMHWRWGVEAATLAKLPFGPDEKDFFGWSAEESLAVKGAPMIPLNQELRIKVEDTSYGTSISPDKDKVIHYKIDVDHPEPQMRHVIFENGFSIAYEEHSNIENILGLFQFNLSGSQSFSVHHRMMRLYDKIRFLRAPGNTDFMQQSQTQSSIEESFDFESF